MTDRDSDINSVRVIQAVEVASILGKGVRGDPIREITEWFLFDGTRIGRQDRIPTSVSRGTETATQIIMDEAQERLLRSAGWETIKGE